MRILTRLVPLLALLGAGCARERPTQDLIADVKSPQEKERLIAVRTLSQRRGEAAEVVPALIEALKDREGDVRRSAAIGLGTFGDKAKEAIPALLAAAQGDRDARVREAARVALSRIDPSRPAPPKGARKGR